MIFIHTSASEPLGRVGIDDEGQVWWLPIKGSPELLAEKDDLCGISIFETGLTDPFRDCCRFHDHAYCQRAFFEERGWNRKDLDDYFLELMLEKANCIPSLLARAYEYYSLVRLIGWIPYSRHPRYVPSIQVGAQQIATMECANLLAEIVSKPC